MRRLHALVAAALGTAVSITVVIAPAQAAHITPVFAFTSDRDGDPDIYVRLSGGRNVKLTHNRVADYDAVWSPDGTRFVFVRAVGTGSALFVMDADGTDLVRLTRTAAHVSDHNPTWSPDGQWVWFDSDRPGYMNREIFRMRPDGSSVQRMTRTADGIDDGAPDISPNGSRVVFSSTRGNGDQDLWTMRPDGTDARRLGSGEEIRDEVFPQWTTGG